MWDYDVRVQPNLDLEVEGTFFGPLNGGMHAEPETDPFVDDLALIDRAGVHALGPDATEWRSACRERCRVRYRFETRRAASLADVDFALEAGSAVFAPPSSWLVHPEAPAKGNYRFRVILPNGVVFATGIRPVRGSSHAYEATVESFAESSFAAIGALRVLRVSPAVELVLAPNLTFTDDVMLEWATSEVAAISAYLGTIPEDRVLVFVLPGTSPVMRGKTLGGGGASTVIRVGTEITASKLLDDWVLPHELLHVAFPDVGGAHTWFSEGLASYVEPIARARAGLISPERVWRDLVEGLPQGRPRPGDAGLESTEEWGRVYWGGALYFLVADIEIRKRTENRRSLRDALSAIASAGGNVERYWPLSRVLAEGDHATGTRVLEELYDRFGLSAGSEDLDALWRELGVHVVGSEVRFDDAAPLAGIRAAITARAGIATRNR